MKRNELKNAMIVGEAYASALRLERSSHKLSKNVTTKQISEDLEDKIGTSAHLANKAMTDLGLDDGQFELDDMFDKEGMGAICVTIFGNQADLDAVLAKLQGCFGDVEMAQEESFGRVHRFICSSPISEAAKFYDDEEYEADSWTERDRVNYSLKRKSDGEEVLDLWDEDAIASVEDGFIDPSDLESSMIKYATDMGLITKRK